MALLHKQLSRDTKCYPERVCFSDRIQDKEKTSFLMKFGLPVLETEFENDTLQRQPIPGTIYVFNEFENNPLAEEIKVIPNIWILGRTAMLEITDDPTPKLRSKPRFCNSMYGLCFHVCCPNDKPLMKRTVQLIKWMGGMFVTDPDLKTTHMITTTSQARGYTYCSTFRVPILTPEWVEDSWSSRHQVNFKAISIMDAYHVGAFTGLYICFKGFDCGSYEDLTRLTKDNGGVVVSMDDPLCTHLVFHDTIASYVNISDVPPHISFVVTADWFWSSVSLEQRDIERSFSCLSSCSISEAPWVEVELPESQSKTNSTENLSTETKKKKSRTIRASMAKNEQNISQNLLKIKDTQRKYVSEELLQTEANYLHCIQILLDLQQQVCLDSPEGAILSQRESRIIFGNLNKILETHKKLYIQLQYIIDNWNNDADIGKAFMSVEDQMMKQYVWFAKKFEVCMAELERCENENRRFKNLVEEINNRRGEHPKCLLIRPIQRLCSVVLLLNEIKKNTPEDSPCKYSLALAIDMVKHVLKAMNDGRVVDEKMRCIFQIHSQIEGCPPDLITSHREFITQFPAQEVSKKIKDAGPNLMFFLFNDMLEVTKVRSKAQRCLTYNTYTPHEGYKPFKHIATLSLSMVLQILWVEEDSKNEQNVKNQFCFNVRDLTDEKKTTVHCFQYTDDSRGLDEVLLKIANQLSKINCSKRPKDYIVKIKETQLPFSEPVYKNTTKITFLKKACYFRNKKETPVKLKRRSISCSELRGVSLDL